jgi:XrtJ-associated TM-motif-TM protein
MKKLAFITVVFALAVVPLSLHAQSGCGDSPEAPTAILALLGGTGTILAAAKARYKARNAIRTQISVEDMGDADAQ